MAKKELKRQSLIKESTRSSIHIDAAEFQKNNRNGQWLDDNSVKKCLRCDKKFTVTLRRHHCRECGGIFCDACSSRKLIISGQLKRVWLYITLNFYVNFSLILNFRSGM